MSVRERTWTTSKGDQREAWIVHYADAHGKPHIKTFDRKSDATDYHASVKVDIKRGVHTSSRMTVAEAGEKWIAACEEEGLEPATVESYRQHLRDHIAPYIGAVKLSQLTVPTVRDLMERLRRDKRSAAMVKRVVGDLGSILADAQERGTVAQNVVRSLSQGRKRRRKAERRQKRKLQVGVDIPSPDEITAIVAHLQGRWRPLLLTAIFAGLRASELRGLRWDDVDLKERKLHVRQRADKFNTIGLPKSESGQRTLPLPSILVNALREWKLACVKTELGLVFPTGERKRRDGTVVGGQVEYHSNIVTRGLAPAQIAAGVVSKDGKPKYPGLHALRHFYASWCINREKDGGLGLPLKNVQQRLGHSTIQMTADVYGHLFPSRDDGAEMDAAANKLVVGIVVTTQTRHRGENASDFNKGQRTLTPLI